MRVEPLLLLSLMACSGPPPAPPGECNGSTGSSYAEGQLAATWSLEDDSGGRVELYDTCGTVAFFETGAMW